MNFGISKKSMALIVPALTQWPEIERAAVFGSRAIGNYKNGSDIDLVIFGQQVNQKLVNQLSVQLNEELPIPYYFDIVHYESLKNESLKEHIDEFAKTFYKKNSRFKEQ